MKVYAGMDIGGTKVALGVFGEDKTLLGKTKYPSDASLSAEEFFQQAATQLRALLGRLALPEEDLAGIGVGLPCMVRYPAGEGGSYCYLTVNGDKIYPVLVGESVF